MRCDLDAATAAEWLHYDPATGQLAWKKSVRNSKAKGTIAGSIDSYGYVRIMVRGRRVKAHRLAWLLMTGDWPPLEIDHINGLKSDNRWKNLRLATPGQQKINRPARRDSKSGLKYVSWRAKDSKWIARLRGNGRMKFIGAFEDQNSAHQAAIAAAKDSYGEFAYDQDRS